MDWLAEVIVTALPFLEGWVSQARVVVTALPAWGPPGIAGALILFLFLFGADHYLFEDED